MFELKLLPGPRLLHLTQPTPLDVTARAYAYLFEPVEVDPAVTLGDIFGLLNACPELVQVYRRCYSLENLEAANLGPLPQSDVAADRIEYLELAQTWHFDSSTKEYETLHRLHVTGMGVVLPVDYPAQGVVAGGRVQWSVSAANLRTLLDVPVRVNKNVVVCENDVDAKAYGKEVATVKIAKVTLGQVLQELLWELSFYGGPAGREEFLASLGECSEEKLIAEIEATDAEEDAMTSVDREDFWESLDRPGIALMFESMGSLKWFDVHYAVKNADDDVNMAEVLSAAFGAEVVVKEEFRGLTAYAFRKTLRLASVDALEPTGQAIV